MTTKPRAGDAPLQEGEIVGVFGRHYRIETHEGEALHAVTRGRKSEIACGDRVEWRATSKGEAVIERVLDREHLLYRSDQFRQKLIASNVDQVAIVVATEPTFSLDLLSRALVAAESADVPAIVVLNKIELPNAARARQRIAPFVQLGYTVVEVSMHAEPEKARAALREQLANKTTVVIGQSGMGKSTLANLLIPGALVATREISEKLDAGKHTTTAAQIHRGDGFRIVDSPGFQEFGLAHLDQSQLENAFVEFRAHLGGCRFTNCRHLDEPNCAITSAFERGEISPARRDLYRQLHSEFKSHVPDYS